jgi:cell division protein FtsB
MRRLAFAVAAVITVGILFVAVFPTRSLLEQHRVRNQTEAQLQALLRRNAALDAQAQKLRSDPEIERLAREHYNLVRPGEEAYAILPSHPDVDPQPAEPAASKAEHPRSGNWLSRLWGKVTDVF